jgi:putative endonuclease
VAGATSGAIGAGAEEVAVRRLKAAGWRILGTNIRLGRLELDIVAVDPGPPVRLVAVEVRFRSRRDFGLAEETFDRRKRARTLAALIGLCSVGRLSDGTRIPRAVPAIDLIVIEPDAAYPGGCRVRHHRDVLA